jgi:hypothetical protein
MFSIVWGNQVYIFALLAILVMNLCGMVFVKHKKYLINSENNVLIKELDIGRKKHKFSLTSININSNADYLKNLSDKLLPNLKRASIKQYVGTIEKNGDGFYINFNNISLNKNI